MNFITWLWGSKYDWQDVERLARGLRRWGHSGLTVFTDRFLTTPNPSLQIDQRLIAKVDHRLLTRSCFARLRMFDPVWQRVNAFSDRIVSLDLDLILVGPIEQLFESKSTFMILQGANEVNPNPYNASVMMLRPGAFADVWNEFSPELAALTRYHEFPDDQGWIWHKIPNADGWKVGAESGIYAFQKPGWKKGSFDLPVDARIVSFIGKRKPKMYTYVPWVKKHWAEIQ